MSTEPIVIPLLGSQIEGITSVYAAQDLAAEKARAIRAEAKQLRDAAKQLEIEAAQAEVDARKRAERLIAAILTEQGLDPNLTETADVYVDAREKRQITITFPPGDENPPAEPPEPTPVDPAAIAAAAGADG